MSSLLELENPIDYVKGEEGKKIISIEDIENDINDKNFKTKIRLLAPCDLQVVKACGVTFAKSMVERVIEGVVIVKHPVTWDSPNPLSPFDAQVP